MSIRLRIQKGVTARLARNWAPEAQANRAETPLVSFTFDDFPKSARTRGAAILNARGVSGTYYTAGGLEGRRDDGLDYFDKEDLIALVEDGHEIGCHSFGHFPLPGATDQQVLADIQRNREFIADALDGYEARTFAYPFGEVTLRKKAVVAQQFAVSRGIFPGVNRNRIDLRQLKSIPLEHRSFDHEAASRALDIAAQSKGWVTFFTHDVSDSPSPYGCRPDDLARLLDDVLARGMQVMSVKDAAAVVTGQPIGRPGHPSPAVSAAT